MTSRSLIVKRSWTAGAVSDPKPRDLTERLVVVRDGKRVSVQNQEIWQDFIRAAIPPGITQFFFFDGEKIQEIAADDHSEVRLEVVAGGGAGHSIHQPAGERHRLHQAGGAQRLRRDLRRRPGVQAERAEAREEQAGAQAPGARRPARGTGRFQDPAGRGQEAVRGGLPRCTGVARGDARAGEEARARCQPAGAGGKRDSWPV